MSLIRHNSKPGKFLDWAPGLDTSAGLYGVLLYTLRRVEKLAELISIEPTTNVAELITNLTKAAGNFLIDSKDGKVEGPLAVSGPEK